MNLADRIKALEAVEEALGVILSAKLDCDAADHVRLAYWMLRANLNAKDPGKGNLVSPISDGRIAEWYECSAADEEEAARHAHGLLYEARTMAENDGDDAPLSTWLFDVLWSATDSLERRYDPEARW